MGKKQKKAEKPKRSSGSVSNDPGDLRNVAAFLDRMIEGSEEAQQALFMLGRDAAWIVQKRAEEMNDANLKAFAKKLVAVSPQVKTNLFELRRDSVKALIR